MTDVYSSPRTDHMLVVSNGSYRYTYNDAWRRFFGTYWVTYGNHHADLFLAGTSQWQGQYDMLTDTNHRGYASNHSYGYWAGRSGSPAGIGYPTYWTSNFHIDHLD